MMGGYLMATSLTHPAADLSPMETQHFEKKKVRLLVLS
jgi:hypothetical protein